MNGFVIIDKPEGWTSHDVIGKLRGVLHERRIGHGGTLDPMATGVLPVFVGRATRAVEFIEAADKEYIFGLKPGIVTNTQDTTGSILESSDAEVSESDILAILPEFIGPMDQIPPMFSAIKIGGKKMYELAHKGIEVERRARRIEIREIELLKKTEEGYLLRTVCSKGTYIRTLCHDMGQRLGCGAAMYYLRRTRVGNFDISQSYTVEDVEKIVKCQSESSENGGFLRPTDQLFAEYPTYITNSAERKKCLNGNTFKVNGYQDGLYRVYDNEGGFLMLGRLSGGMMETVKSFFEVQMK